MLWDMERVKDTVYAVVANSGNANACTGEKGIEDARASAAALAELIGKKAENVLVASTGVIGVNLPMDKIIPGIKTVYESVSEDGGVLASEAIMTTDTVPKTAAAEINVGGKTVTIGGMAKGSGMINPNMATMLCFITTDCAIEKPLLDKALKETVSDSFHLICGYGGMSTDETLH